MKLHIATKIVLIFLTLNIAEAFAMEKMPSESLLIDQTSHLLDALIHNPHEALAYIRKGRNRCVKKEIEENKEIIEGQNFKQGLSKYKEIIEKYEKLCPIHQLGECVNEDGSHCLLSRTYQPQYRNAFEKRVSNELVKASKTKDNQIVHYGSFCSGGGFQDLVILTKALHEKPDGKFSIHLIDMKYTPLVACLDLLNQSRQITATADDLDLNSIKEYLCDYARKNFGGEKMDDENILNEMAGQCYVVQTIGKQFISWLQKQFPKACLSLYFHDTAESYYTYIQKHSMLPDIITAADILDESSRCKQAHVAYVKLCLQLKRDNKSSKNFWLLKLTRSLKRTGAASIATIHLTNIKNSEKLKLKLDGKERMISYIKSRTIVIDVK